MLVSPQYEMRVADGGQALACFDDADYGPSREMTDAEFAAGAGGAAPP